MNKQGYKPTDTAELLEWLWELVADHEKRLGESVDDYQDYTQAKFHQIFMQAVGLVASHVEVGKFALDESPESPSVPDHLQVLGEIWDKWKHTLYKQHEITQQSSNWSGEYIVNNVHDRKNEDMIRHFSAVSLALAVHMEIDSTSGCTSKHSVVMDELGVLHYAKSQVRLPHYLQYKSPKEAWRACSLLRSIRGPLFFVFKKNTEEVSHD